MNQKRNGDLKIYFNEEKYVELVELIIKSSLNVIKVLKNDNRSRVLLIEYKGELLVVKEPKEKNRRKWQKLLAIFRGSEAYREFINCQRIIDLGFKGAKSIVAIETFKNKLIDKSYFVSTYVKGKEGSVEELDIISKELNKIHEKGYLHGDSQLTNFMVSNEGIYLIDCKLINNKYGKFGEKYEFIYLEESCGKQIGVYSKDDIYYRGAISLNQYRHWLGKMKKKIRRKK